jgi:hypothetical protein
VGGVGWIELSIVEFPGISPSERLMGQGQVLMELLVPGAMVVGMKPRMEPEQGPPSLEEGRAFDCGEIGGVAGQGSKAQACILPVPRNQLRVLRRIAVIFL